MTPLRLRVRGLDAALLPLQERTNDDAWSNEACLRTKRVVAVHRRSTPVFGRLSLGVSAGRSTQALRRCSFYFAPERPSRRSLSHVQRLGYFFPIKPAAAEAEHGSTLLGKAAAKLRQVQAKFQQSRPTGSECSLRELSAPAHELQTIKLHRVPAKGPTKGAHKYPPRILRERVGASPVKILGDLGHRLLHQFRRVAGVT